MVITGMVNSQTVLLTVAVEQQPCGVQVVERVGLVASSLQVVKWVGLVFLLQ
jgi:hypothetical protein